MQRPVFLILLAILAAGFAVPAPACAQAPNIRYGEAVPRDVREMYDRGLQFLVATQNDNGSWTGDQQPGPGTTGLALMVFLASGEDPNYGLYSNQVRKALRSIISGQNAQTGYFGEGGAGGHASMYHHGFAMLALAEAYGAVDERTLWPEGGAAPPGRRSIGQALELAVRLAVTSQKKNPIGGWRYSPDARDADTSVSGSILVGLLAARNAGVEVPDDCIERAVAYYRSCTSSSGQVAYAGGIGGFDHSVARISIGSLVFSLARRKDLKEHAATVNNLKQNLENNNSPYREYALYYQSQALFQGDVEAWEKWNTLLIRQLKQSQQPDGSFKGQFGTTLSTSFSLLALALNYRFLPIYER